MCVSVCVCIHIHIHIYTYIHLHIHTDPYFVRDADVEGRRLDEPLPDVVLDEVLHSGHHLVGTDGTKDTELLKRVQRRLWHEGRNARVNLSISICVYLSIYYAHTRARTG